ncbi:MAG: methionine--tRNA ligase subunit beta [Candidatus Omnitrophica bacterium]|nr:methionine--tRNA ligase subunit beta [Candidatus Omnitrophota bacterium]
MLNIEDFQKAELRVAEILEAKEHPNADRLFVLKVHDGVSERQVVAGIRSSYSPEELVGKKVVILANLEPATIRGVESQGMLLAASSDQGPVLISPEKNVPNGSKIK